MRRNHNKISPTAFNHIIFRTFYGLPLANDFAKAAEKFSPRENLFNANTLRKLSFLFEGRYVGGEKALEKFIVRNQNCTILELAAGFSLHGLDLAKKYPKIKYIETDLGPIIKLKEKIIKKMGINLKNMQFKSANALDSRAVKNALPKMKRGFKIAFYCEGLLSYFNTEEKIMIANIIKTILTKNGGVWITPDPALGANTRQVLKKALPIYRQTMGKAEKLAKQKYDEHGFVSESETDKFFQGCGFAIRKYSWPTKLNSFAAAGFNQSTISKLKRILKDHGKVWVLTVKE